jgi:hypothetical protein
MDVIVAGGGRRHFKSFQKTAHFFEIHMLYCVYNERDVYELMFALRYYVKISKYSNIPILLQR